MGPRSSVAHAVLAPHLIHALESIGTATLFKLVVVEAVGEGEEAQARVRVEGPHQGAAVVESRPLRRKRRHHLLLSL